MRNSLLRNCESYLILGRVRVAPGKQSTQVRGEWLDGWTVHFDYLPNWSCDCHPSMALEFYDTWEEAMQAAQMYIKDASTADEEQS
jgi:hypothetical protein